MWLKRWERSPLAYVIEFLGETPTHQQAEILKAFEHYRFVAVKSGHGIGKSRLTGWLVNWWLDTRGKIAPVTGASGDQLYDVVFPQICAPQLLGLISPKQEALWRITFLPSTMAFNSIRFFTSESEIMVVVGSLYWTILHLTEKYSASDEQLLQYFKTLGDKSRLDIVRLLKDRSYSGQELSKELGISQGTVSHHLNILIRDELISILKDGNRIRCTLNPSTVEHMINSIRQLLLT